MSSALPALACRDRRGLLYQSKRLCSRGFGTNADSREGTLSTRVDREPEFRLHRVWSELERVPVLQRSQHVTRVTRREDVFAGT